MRSKRVRSEVSDDGLENVLWSGPTQEHRLEFQAFRRAFRLLSPAHREVLILVAVQGHPYEQAAEIAGCEVGTIRSRLNRARSQLKRMLLEGEFPMTPPKTPPEGRRLRIGPERLPAWLHETTSKGASGPVGPGCH